MMEKRLEAIRSAFLTALQSVHTDAGLDKLRILYLGRKGRLTMLLRQIKDLPASDRPRIGHLGNTIRNELEQGILDVRRRLGTAPREKPANFDATLPGAKRNLGHLHPITLMQYQLEDVCRQMGFMVLDGPEIESEYYNFNALNIPPDHPARDTQDTFWLTDGNLLRTHTSPVQVRALQKYGAPFRGIVPGRAFRYEATDASHDHTFYQMEGLMVDRDISISNLVAMMQAILQGVFQSPVDIRLRPGYFPFVEPGFELDSKCLICGGKGCSVCKHTGWLELMPCGLVHPNVLREANIDPREFSGFAFGLGLTRLVMLKYGIDDIRLLMSGDLRFLNQFDAYAS